jgi:hypothetical protein
MNTSSGKALAATVDILDARYEVDRSRWERSLMVHLFSPQAVFRMAMLVTLRRRVKYGGRKGRRAVLRLAGRA